jgi:hypothetical protein
MRFDWRQYNTGMGELLCFVLAWAIGAVALWSNYVGRAHNASGDNVAVSGAAPASQVDFD